MKKESPQFNRRQVITAAEVGEFAYCAKAWYLKRCGETAQGEQLAAGVAFHQRHAAGVAQAKRLKRAGETLALLALILLSALIVIWLATTLAR